MQKIVPSLWFDKEAKETAQFYVETFGDYLDSKSFVSKINNINTLHNTPSGDTEIIDFQIWGYSFNAFSAGPMFKLNPSISFMVNFDPSQNKQAKKQLDQIWEKLAADGEVLMPLGKYDFSKHYGWVQDKFGLSWQLIYTDPDGEPRPLIIPSLLFVGEICGQAEEATNFYIDVFKQSARGIMAKYPPGMELDQEGMIMFTDFKLLNQWFVAMDSAQDHKFAFNEAISFIINCKTQAEIDYYWDKLSAVPESEQCGWLKDKYGLSWQMVPTILDELLATTSSAQKERFTQAFLKMKKLNIAKLKKLAGQ